MKESSMSKDFNDYELRDEYDLSQLLIVPKGRYAPSRRLGRNVVVLEPNLANAFPNDESVNKALQLILQLAKVPQLQKVGATV